MIHWITDTMSLLGYAGVAGLMFLENLFPPIPSEVIMPLAGFTAARGDLNFILVGLAGTVGSIVGACFWYFIARFVGENRIKAFADRYGKWLTLNRKEVDKSLDWFEKHGEILVFFGRMIPAIRTIISIPAGLARMHFGTFLFYTALGSAIWTFALAYAGFLLEENWKIVEGYVGPVATAVVILCILYYCFRLWRELREEKERKDDKR